MFEGKMSDDIYSMLDTAIWLSYQCTQLKFQYELVDSLAKEARIEREQHNMEHTMETIRGAITVLQKNLESLDESYKLFKERMEL